MDRVRKRKVKYWEKRIKVKYWEKRIKKKEDETESKEGMEKERDGRG